MWLLALTYTIDAVATVIVLAVVWAVGMMAFLILRNLWRRVRHG